MAMKRKQNMTKNAGKPDAARKSKAATSRSKQSIDPVQPFIVRGMVTYPNKLPATGLVVIAFDKDLSGENELGQRVTEADGYRIAYTADQFRLTKNERRGADVFIRIYDAENNVLFQSNAVNNAPADFLLNVQLPAKTFVVRGQIRLADGSPCAGATVRAYDKDLRSKEQIGKPTPVTTDKSGRYEIAYTSEQFSRSEKSSADLLVEARQHKEARWIAAPIRFNAQSLEIIDITLDGVYRGPSEFSRLVAELTPLLDGMTLSQLKENAEFQDITFLSNETGIDRQLISLLSVGALRGQEEDRIQHEEYYGLFRQNLPKTIEALLEKSIDTLHDALDKSARDNIIRPLSEQALADFVSRVQQVKASRLLHPSAESGPASLGDLLAIAIDAGKRPLIARIYSEQGGATDAFWRLLEEDSSVKAEEVKEVKRAFALGDFTNNHLPLVNELYRIGKENAAFAELRGFAQWDEAEWQAVLQRPQDATDANIKSIGFPPGEESIESYARTLSGFIEATYPMAVISNRIERDNSNESPFNEAKTDLLTFFANNPEFSFAATPLVQYLNGDANEKLRGIENPNVLKVQLKSMQRIFNITGRYQGMYALLADDLHSSTAVVYVGERWFAEKYGALLGGTENARETYKRAEHVHATALNVYMKRADAFNSPSPYVISGGMRESRAQRSDITVGSHALVMTHMKDAVPDYSELFGSFDLCNCRHCLSLYSPAAYLVDILKFLRDGPLKNGMSPLQVLLTRRPDLEHIELTCENTNTRLPYVDLVNEILEAGVAPRTFVIEDGADIATEIAELDELSVPARLRTAFVFFGYALTDAASVRLEDGKGDRAWIIIDKGWAFSLKYQGAKEGIHVYAWPQTSWTTEELRANPEHIHAKAYAKLRDAVYPWSLPLNLPLEEARAYLGNLGVRRHELLEVYFFDNAIDAISDTGIALEYLGLAKEEADIITGLTTRGPVGTPLPAGAWNFWGLQDTNNHVADRINSSAPHADGDWDVVLQRVSIFLQQSNLSYKELLELLGTHFINPPAPVGTPGGRRLAIVSAANAPVDTCDRSRLEIRVVDDTVSDGRDELKSALNKLHRFVRLWRKLGWTMRDLDKVISTQPKNANGEVDINDEFLKRLSHIQRLHAETGLPIVNLLSWFADIDTRIYVDQLADGEPAAASLYAQLFTNKTVSGQFIGEDSAALSGSLSGKASAIAAALQISVEDLTLLQAAILNSDALSLINLSRLYRHATLAKVVKLPIRSFLNTLELVDNDPFSNPANTHLFIQRINKIHESGFKVEELYYLLRNKHSPMDTIALGNDEIAFVLDAVRRDLQKVIAENNFVKAEVDDSAATSDPNGDLTRKKLALLNWSPALIEDVIAALNGARTYKTKPVVLTPTIVFPESFNGKLSYDATEATLSFVGTMTTSDRTLLEALPNVGVEFPSAVGKLFDAPRRFIKRCMAGFSVRVFEVAVADAGLKLLLENFKFPDALKNKIYYDMANETSRFVGVMTEAEHNVLSKLSSDMEYLKNIKALFDAPETIANAPFGADVFLTGADAVTLFNGADAEPQERFLLVLKTLLPYLRKALSEAVVKQHLGEYLNLDATTISGLLNEWIKRPFIDSAHPDRMAIADFLDPVFVESSPHIKLTKDVFPRQFDTFLLLYKISIITLKFNASARQLQWLFEPKLNTGRLDLNALPLAAPTAATTLFKGWERVADLFRLRDVLPRGEVLLTEIFTAAIAPAAQSAPASQMDKVLGIIATGTQWNPEALGLLSGTDGFDLSVSDFAAESAMLRLSGAIALMTRLGASANQCVAWSQLPPTVDSARELKSLVRAKYDDAQWLDLAKSLRDPLRERQRSALAAYLVQDIGMRDAGDLYDHFLIDVEMGSCMMTTRIKQAIGSVQLFIQRALMNLDDEVALTPKEAEQWSTWRKWYRVWEANRKVFLYPENWIEPELRDDKSPFFKELENELLQSDVTMATAEDAFVHYLEKLDQVARLEIVGMYRQESEDTLHVIGRTYAIPHIYFYRRSEKTVWSAWEKVDLDVEGDHLIPVSWNRRLYLFWAIFTEKSEQPTKEQRVSNDDPAKYWEIKLAWSEYKNRSWSQKRISKKPLRRDKRLYPDIPDSSLNAPQESQDFSFKAGVQNGKLAIGIYGAAIVEEIISSESVTEQPPAPTSVQFISILLPHRDLFNNPLTTHLSCRFLVNGAKPNPTERAKIRIQIRNPEGVIRENNVPISVNGAAYSNSGYTETLFVDMVSEGFGVLTVEESGSWSMPFDPFNYASAVVEACVDAVAEQGIAVARTVVDAAIASAVTAAVLSAGNLGVIIAAVITAVTAAISGIALADVTNAASRIFGRRVIVDLQALPLPPPVTGTTTVTSIELKRMQRIGEFTLDDCNGDLIIAPIGEINSNTLPTSLLPYPSTKVQSMRFVESSGEHSLVTLSPGNGNTILSSTPGTFRLLAPHQDFGLSPQSPFFFQDDQRTYFVSPSEDTFQFSIFFHPRVCDFIEAVNQNGVPGLLTLQNQQITDSGGAFWSQYSPAPLYQSFNSAPRENVDFGIKGSYSLYNWELFFHTPFLIAMQLSKNQRFEEAQKWFHYIFDPTATDSPGRSGSPGIERFWRVKPFYEEATKSIQTLEQLITDSNALGEQVSKWEADPFKPHVIARMRVVAYMKAVVMRYIDNLVEWGDQLFRRDTIESINEATHLYILAGRILGRRPESIPARVKAKVQTFHTLDDVDALDSLSNAMVEIESFLAPSVAPVSTDESGHAPSLKMRYFCITGNDKLLGYWDTVSDRLFKIRHCMNIEGVERSLPIFEPPIDPAILVRAAAAGVDIASALNDMNAPVPHYRFNATMQKASELCGDVGSLGGAFLSALEKRDAEALALLRSTHEVELLKVIRGIKQQQIDEANNTLQGLMQFQEIVTARQQYYLSRPFMNPFEEGHAALTAVSLIAMEAHLGADVLAAVLHLIPNIKTASPVSMGATYGGDNVGPAAQAFGSAAGTTASMMGTAASMSATLGGYQRRQDDWTHQAELATKELKQVGKQIAAAEIRLAITEQELQNHDRQIENAKEVDDHMRHRKFTNQELYGWMVGQLSGIYFQSYRLAYDVAKRAERAYRYELGLRDSNFIQFGHWDSLKKGLLSGERLHLDLKRMDVAYLDKNRREYEIAKHISLVTIDPISFVRLKETGECFITLPEALFDIDYPGHYMRRIKSVSITIPCVTGPYSSVNCTLTQLNSSIRHANTLSGGAYLRRTDDTRFSDSFGSIQSIVTSSGQNDSGLFEANLRDERYLPFEGQGAIGTWRIQLPMKFKSFEYATISDIVMHLRYTSRDGGELLRQRSLDSLMTAVNAAAQSADQNGLARGFSLRHEFPSEWSRFLNPPAGAPGDQAMKLSIEKTRFPFLFQSTTIALSGIKLFVKIKPEFAATHDKDTLKISLQPGAAASVTPLPLTLWNGLLRAEIKPAGALGNWTLAAWLETGGVHKHIDSRAIEDLVVVCGYTIAP